MRMQNTGGMGTPTKLRMSSSIVELHRRLQQAQQQNRQQQAQQSQVHAHANPKQEVCGRTVLRSQTVCKYHEGTRTRACALARACAPSC